MTVDLEPNGDEHDAGASNRGRRASHKPNGEVTGSGASAGGGGGPESYDSDSASGGGGNKMGEENNRPMKGGDGPVGGSA